MAKKKTKNKNKSLVLFLIIGGLLLLASVFALQNKQTVGSRASVNDGKNSECFEKCLANRWPKRNCNSALDCENLSLQASSVIQYCFKQCGNFGPTASLKKCDSNKDCPTGKECSNSKCRAKPNTAPKGKKSLPVVNQGEVCFVNGQYVASCKKGSICTGDNDSATCQLIPAGKQPSAMPAGGKTTTNPAPKAKDNTPNRTCGGPGEKCCDDSPFDGRKCKGGNYNCQSGFCRIKPAAKPAGKQPTKTPAGKQ